MRNRNEARAKQRKHWILPSRIVSKNENQGDTSPQGNDDTANVLASPGRGR
jgi:hypothetical protein